MNKTLVRTVVGLSLLALSCSHPKQTGGTAAGGWGAPTWEALDTWLSAQMKVGVMDGYAMQVFGADDELLHESVTGACKTTPSCPPGDPAWSVDLVTGVASSSKWVTSTTVLAVLDEAVAGGRWATLDAALDAPISKTLDCGLAAGAVVGTITVRELLSFTSGLVADHACVGATGGAGAPAGGWTLQTCACAILQASEAAMGTSAISCGKDTACPPGSAYVYADTHHVVAGAVVERLASASWNDVFQAKVRGPLGLAMTYGSGTLANPNLAGSIHASVADYATFVRAVFHDGHDGTHHVLSQAAVDAQRSAEVPLAATIVLTPQPDFQYGLNNWRWCLQPVGATFVEEPSLDQLAADPSCSGLFSVGHGGKGGYMPWIDVQSGAYGVFAMRQASPGGDASYSDAENLVTTTVRTMSSLVVAGDAP